MSVWQWYKVDAYIAFYVSHMQRACLSYVVRKANGKFSPKNSYLVIECRSRIYTRTHKIADKCIILPHEQRTHCAFLIMLCPFHRTITFATGIQETHWCYWKHRTASWRKIDPWSTLHLLCHWSIFPVYCLNWAFVPLAIDCYIDWKLKFWRFSKMSHVSSIWNRWTFVYSIWFN